jgi:glycosyltransferase involved in cell wall biosynthesis
MPKISAAIITYNEEKNIERCITSLVNIADEIVVVDSGSNDKTQEIALTLGAKVVINKFEGHIQQKNFAITQTSNEWVISLDADEALSKKLKTSLLKVKEDLKGNGYKFNRLSNYCGKWIKHCGWYPDTKLRLFKKGQGSWKGKNPHDKYILDSGEETHLEGDLLHYTFYNVSEHKAQIIKFSNVAAQSLFELNKKSNWALIIGKTVFKFFRNYLLKRGFLDGITGFHICRLSAHATYLRYYKLLKLHKNNVQTS